MLVRILAGAALVVMALSVAEAAARPLMPTARAPSPAASVRCVEAVVAATPAALWDLFSTSEGLRTVGGAE
ncbi:MAG: hypothetical protein R3C16_08890 [Hyphomonadaceae bacterium]